MYDDAWMPHMNRITWNGIALHGGRCPGYAAAHGCVRMPFGFAQKLFGKTRIGMRSIISPNDAAPVELSHPALFMRARMPSRLLRREPKRSPARPRRPPRSSTRPRSCRGSGARDSIAHGVAGQADIAQDAHRRRARVRRQGTATAKTDQAKARPRSESRRPLPGPRKRIELVPPQRRCEVEARRRRRKGRRQDGGGQEGRHRPRRLRSMRISQSCRSRSTSAARRRSFTCDATRKSRGRTEARCSIQQHRGSGHDPQSREADRHERSPRWRAATPAFAGLR